MTEFIPWNSQPLEEWAGRYAAGNFVDLQGRRTHYLDLGEGPPVVLVHGFNLDSHTWMRNLEHLAGRFRVIVPDLWGQGYSTRQPLDYGYNLFVEQLRLLMEALELRKASLVGHSMGGGASLVFALRYREMVDRLVLVDSTGIPTTLPFRAKVFRLQGVAELLLGLRTNRIRRQNLTDVWLHGKTVMTEDEYLALVRYQKVAGSTEALLAILRKDFFNTLEYEIQELGRLDIPTLIIWGREDISLPLRCAEEMQRLMPASRLEILDDAAHLANFDRPRAFNELVSDFLMASEA